MKHLTLKHRKYYFQVNVPKDLIDTLGKKNIKHPLSRDLRESEIECLKHTHYYDDLFERLRTESTNDLDHLVKSIRQAHKLQSYEAEEGMFDLLLEKIDHLVDNKQLELSKAESLVDAATTQSVLLEDLITQYQSEDTVSLRYQKQKQSIFDTLLRYYGNIGIELINKRKAGDYVRDVIVKNGGALATQKNKLTPIGNIFTWAVDRGMIADNPFTGISRTLKSGAKAITRSEYTKEELIRIYQNFDADPKLKKIKTMATISLYTSGRIEEIAQLKVTDVEGNHLHIRGTKTKAAERKIPIHSHIQKLIAQLAEDSYDGYLISGLGSDTFDDKRSHAISKQYGRFKSKLGYGREKNFHTFRRNFIQQLEEHKVPLETAKTLCGHERDDITFGLYSSGVSDEALREELEKIDFSYLL